jgi:cytoskeletal protein CcmA (bactofilin family)
MSMRTVEPTTFGDQYGAETAVEQESVSVIDRFSSFDGTYQSSRDIRVEGQVKGTISCQGMLHVAQGANVNARVDAENITVAGELEGEITCKGRLQILPSGRVRGKIETATLVINEGAFYEGQLEMTGGTSLSSGRLSRNRAVAGGTSSPTPINGDSSRPAETPNGGNTFIRRFGGQEQTWDGGTPVGEAGPADEEE